MDIFQESFKKWVATNFRMVKEEVGGRVARVEGGKQPYRHHWGKYNIKL